MTPKSASMLERFTVMLPAILWLIWMAVFVWLLDGGRYRAFLQPKFWPLPVVGLAVVTLFLIAFRLRPPSQDLRWRRWVAISLLIVPAIYVYTTYGQSLGANALAGRSTGSADIFSLEELRKEGSAPAYDPDRPVLLSTLAMNPEVFVGKTITVKGGVYRDQNVPASYFLMFRFYIFCCAADAIPVWIVVESPESSRLETETWVEVTGRFSLEMINNNKVPLLVADALEEIEPPPPELRYLYF
jgi:uncharacterized repeat protein (TIGR03943 family)